MEILYTLFIGAISGWFAGLLVKGEEYGLLWNIIMGVLGSVVGGWLLTRLGIHPNLGNKTLDLIVTSVIGAVLVLLLSSLLKTRTGTRTRRR
jgi:uncharacterized membrane protein YeaQ/YmgE (transglycosylase-associated protein family)